MAKNTTKTDLGAHMIKSYMTMRLLLAFIGLSMPILLGFGGMVLKGIPFGTHSMSAYYHLNADPGAGEGLKAGGLGVMRDVFVGGLFAIGVLLLSYRGIRLTEHLVLSAAGLAVWGVAYFPMDWQALADTKLAKAGMSLHGGCAVAAFLCIGYVCIFRSKDTLSEKLAAQLHFRHETKKAPWNIFKNDTTALEAYRRTYNVLGCLMVILPLVAWKFSFGGKGNATFWVEAAGIWVFSLYWIVKSFEMQRYHTEEKAVREEVKVPDLNPATVCSEMGVELVTDPTQPKNVPEQP